MELLPKESIVGPMVINIKEKMYCSKFIDQGGSIDTCGITFLYSFIFNRWVKARVKLLYYTGVQPNTYEKGNNNIFTYAACY